MAALELPMRNGDGEILRVQWQTCLVEHVETLSQENKAGNRGELLTSCSGLCMRVCGHLHPYTFPVCIVYASHTQLKNKLCLFSPLCFSPIIYYCNCPDISYSFYEAWYAPWLWKSCSWSYFACEVLKVFLFSHDTLTLLLYC